MSEVDTVQKIDILEDDIYKIDTSLLKLLLKDKTTRENILWCTTDYEFLGQEYNERMPMQVELITDDFSHVIQPRAAKSREVQRNRIKDHAEVFTPSWVCNEQNNTIDEAWFNRPNVFNKSEGNAWSTNNEHIEFPGGKKTWKAYVDAKRLEITCGEAPYLVSRYDTTTGETIPLYERIGLFDRKMRVVDENCLSTEEWLKWSIRAVRSVYGYDFQGDNILIARENLLFDYIDYYIDRMKQQPPTSLLIDVANIIAWNIWQMDGLKYVVPYSCHETVIDEAQMDLFGETEKKTLPCPGCTSGNIHHHNGVYCRIFDWTNLKKSIPFISILGDK